MKRTLFLLALFLGTCALPSAPTADRITLPPEATTDELSFALSELSLQKECVGATRTVEVRVVFHEGFFDCGGVAANGCLWDSQTIHVNHRVFEPALSHELIHMWEVTLGHAFDYAHTSPVWGKCDRLNH